ncbi:hypothetical protein MG290_00015 [Flavobacterium sp. CBA20B-1]|uniref:hypothetical protein n=1 Tax=unclassified Flavobacterium TaxID=196869 RepID=UPI002223F68C|nr:MULTISPECIES: hypothetical protein [unclassified Flavobacterium]WCM42097.1 hypothetical protein MG290_00015 [Flavobacterium sp. CBA20B-1]
MKKYFSYKIDFKLLVLLIITFIVFTIIGTVSHESGHYIAAKFVGLDALIHYASTSILIPDDFKGVITQSDQLLFTLGGPLQTIITGTLGLLLLYFNRKKISSEKLKTAHWFYIFLSLFWLRQTFNFIIVVTKYFMNGRYPKKMDEIKIARNLDINDFSILIPTAFIGIFVTLFIIFKYIPYHQRFTFIISGLIGGSLGFYLWLVLFGKFILP